ncbi:MULTISPECIES: glucose-6-phosphate isomerase [unclassified Caballeronia]|uniref:glucose-6-phosphate isomerase n=1 Tax=unclassified Caballeronia TaxID=2646786 RepID=UPI002866DFB0|nr:MULTISPECIES: glucose-6-phosphate isomerase [unclassified Caballeronia]MDR5741192.1 glucose-6-phosphate isomerase [Caballeronia sp. LZ016]MDR5807090.1 glucose-6-phosphate isomerase [Caballeronia sp. LZ019]
MKPSVSNWPEPRAFNVDLSSGLMEGTGTRYQKRLKDLQGLYADAEAFAALVATHGDDIVYDVTDHRPSDAPGDLITGVTRMTPGKVGDEFFMTRGHIHANIDRPELYFGLKGRGLMLMESPDGDTRIVDIAAHTVCYVPPRWIHRSVNLGADDFVMLFCYPADAGQDYAIIERANGMKLRIVDDGDGGYRSETNPAYVARDEAQIAELLARTERAR